MESRPLLISELFSPKQVDIHPWHFPNFLQNPEYIRIPTAKSISIANGDGQYGFDESKEKIWDFLYDKNGYANRSIVSICLKKENHDFLEQLVQVNLAKKIHQKSKFNRIPSINYF